MKEIVTHIKQVRSELRFYMGKPIPDYSAKKAEEVMERFLRNMEIYRRRLRTSSADGLQRQLILRELTKLKVDLDVFVLKRKNDPERILNDNKKIPVLQAVVLLCDTLGAKPIKHLFQRT